MAGQVNTGPYGSIVASQVLMKDHMAAVWLVWFRGRITWQQCGWCGLEEGPHGSSVAGVVMMTICTLTWSASVVVVLPRMAFIIIII
jgi:hypothetical protein